MATVGLCMIVKDEAHVLQRLADSVRDLIDHWTVVDTGSTDGTQELVPRVFAGLPGELHERPWRDFGHNRSEALALGRRHTDYLWMIDADETVDVGGGFAWPELTADSYSLLHRLGAYSYWRTDVLASRLPWRYAGVLHEYPECEQAVTHGRVPGLAVVVHEDGGRSQGLTTAEKYARDAVVLETALAAEPDNTRNQFYLARSYRDSAQPTRALAAFQRRVAMGGWAEEVYDSLHTIALLKAELAHDRQSVVAAFLAAHAYRPSRAEALCSLARWCREHQQWPLGRMAAREAMSLPRPDDLLFVDDSVYAWRAQDEFAVASYWLGDRAACAEVCERLLAGDVLPADQVERVRENLRFAQER